MQEDLEISDKSQEMISSENLGVKNSQLCLVDSHVNQLAKQDTNLGVMMIDGYGQSTLDLSERPNQNGFSLRMLTVLRQYQSLNKFTPIWKKKITKSGYTTYQLQMLERPILGGGVLLLPTPMASDYKRVVVAESMVSRHSPDIAIFAAALQERLIRLPITSFNKVV